MGQDGNLVTDIVIRFEALEEGMSELSTRLGVEIGQLPHRNRTKRAPYRECFNNETAETLRKHFARDIDYFGYEY